MSAPTPVATVGTHSAITATGQNVSEAARRSHGERAGSAALTVTTDALRVAASA